MARAWNKLSANYVRGASKRGRYGDGGGLYLQIARQRRITGVSWFAVELVPKQLEVLWEALGRRASVGLLVNPNNDAERMIEDIHRATHEKGVRFSIFRASTASQIVDAFHAASKTNIDGLIVGADPFFGISQREHIVKLAAQYRIPAVYNRREYATIGGFLSYGAKEPAAYRQTGVYVGRVLKGERPSDLPVLQPTTFELIVNLNTARALGITVPPTLLARADEVIE
jgi:putative ABC transport system substrate-binding protein